MKREITQAEDTSTVPTTPPLACVCTRPSQLSVSSFIMLRRVSGLLALMLLMMGCEGNQTEQQRDSNSLPQRTEFRIAWLAPRKVARGISASTSVNALKVALQVVERTYLPGYKIRVKWYDSQCTPKAALASAVDARSDFDPDVFLGPPCSEEMSVVAMLASHWNLPVIGWMSNDHELQDRHTYTTLIRTFGPLSQFASTMNYVRVMFGWRRFAMLYDVDTVYRSTHNAITSVLNEPEADTVIMSAHQVYEDMPDDEIRDIFKQIRKYARILIFSVPWFSMRKYVLVAHELNMTRGDFVFICMNSDVYTRQKLIEVQSDKSWRRNDTRDEDAREAFEAVIYVMMAQAKRHFDVFEQLVSTAEKFNQPRWELPQSNGSIMDAYAPFLYDATSVWAILTNLSLLEGKDPRNGSHVLQKVAGLTLDGLTDSLVFDNYGDRQVNNWFLDMGPEGDFRICSTIINSYTGGSLKEHHNISWPDGRVGSLQAPPDVPICGFDGELCVTEPPPPIPASVTAKEDPIVVASIGGSVGATVVIVAAFIIHFYFRHQRNKQKWAGLMWQVKMAEVDFLSAILCDSVRSSFRKLGRRKSSAAVKKSGKSQSQHQLRNLNFMDPADAKTAQDNNGTTFGSVCYFKGSIVSVKRVTKVNITKDLISQFNHLLDLKCQNLTPFLGCIMDNDRHYMLLWEYCAKGSLQDIIFNTNIKLDKLFKFAMCQDVAKGLDYLHKTYEGFHGNLKSTNCVVDSRWTCKLTDFGVPELRAVTRAKQAEGGSMAVYERDLWTAPEILRGDEFHDYEMRQADVYALGIIMKELFTRTGPYTEFQGVSAKEIIEKVKHPNCGAFRPMIPADLQLEVDLTSLIYECWAEDPNVRPSPGRVTKALNRINPNKHNTVIDNMLAMLEKYANHLEELVAERTSELDLEKKKTEKLLYRMLPQTVAEDLKLGKPVKAEMFDQVTIYFSDIVGFTKICAQSTPIEVVNLLNSLYTLFDDIITGYDVYKVETIGDAYMLASGLPKRNGDRHISQIADVSLDIMGSIDSFVIPHLPDRKLHIRIGIHTGSVVAGVVGLAMPRYCLFGDAVNTASRMESTGLPMKIHMSPQAHDKLVNNAEYHMAPRGEITVKGKGTMSTYFLVGKEGFHKRQPTVVIVREASLSRHKIRIAGTSSGGTVSLHHSNSDNTRLHEADWQKDSGDSSGQHVRRNASVSSDTCPLVRRARTLSSVRFSLDDETEGLEEVNVKSLRKNFEPLKAAANDSSILISVVPDTAAGVADPPLPDVQLEAAQGKTEDLFVNGWSKGDNDMSEVPAADVVNEVFCRHNDISEVPVADVVDEVFCQRNILQELPLASSVLPITMPVTSESPPPHPRKLGLVLNNYSPEEMKRNNGSLERERQQQLQKKLEDIERVVLNSPAINQLERLFVDPKAESKLLNGFQGKAEPLSGLELRSNILNPIVHGHKRSASDEKGRHSHSVLGHLYFKEPKQANTAHRNSPQNSRPSSPKPDVAIFKDQLSTRMQQRGLELVTHM